ncbi:PREDICTED: uncharacterized protein LOC108567317 [Nicrophorus vespilloides]|uniref:Uncharacterized protein LOC108567317 n=1 Tax=Nicrophorus vespilloides TaxID=110193 RepID=A0ABM1N8P5_NICVS|nr:PREDICTED: uncharacterized protein LOC108567317 [Nicrophorus vespilloides]
MEMEYPNIERPEGSVYPKIYKEFEGKLRDDGRRKFWIQDLTEEYFDEVIKGCIEGFSVEEPLCKCTKSDEDEDEGDSEWNKLWMSALKEKLSLICLTKNEEGQTKIAGFNCLVTFHKDEIFEPKSENSRNMFGMFQNVSDQRNAFEEFKLDMYLSAMGLYVYPEFRGERIGQFLLDARKDIGKLLGFKASLTFFTSTVSQKLAYRVGFKDYVTVPYVELLETHKDFLLPSILDHSKELKYMYMLY